MKKPRPAKKIGRKRRAAGWVLLALGVLVAAVWVGSCVRWDWRWDSGCYVAGLGHGILGVAVGDTPEDVRGDIGTREIPAEGRRVEWLAPTFEHVSGDPAHWNFGLISGVDARRQRVKGLAVAVWPVPLLLWTPAALLLRSGILARRRAMTGACAKCGYSLAGLAKDAPCPECGKAKA